MLICRVHILQPVCYSRPMYEMHVWLVAKKIYFFVFRQQEYFLYDL